MVQRGQRPGLAPEPREPFRVGRELVGQDLEGDLAIELGIARATHLAHPPDPDQGANLARTDARAWYQRH
jgi:hypothetical protein